MVESEGRRPFARKYPTTAVINTQTRVPPTAQGALRRLGARMSRPTSASKTVWRLSRFLLFAASVTGSAETVFDALVGLLILAPNLLQGTLGGRRGPCSAY